MGNGYRNEGHFGDYDYEFGDDMTIAATHCNRFEGRTDVNVFNMIDYCSCENCKHLLVGDRCRFQRY